jgi:hypothetical protein
MANLSLRSPLFVYSTIYNSKDSGDLFYTFGYNLILLYFITQFLPLFTIECSFSWLLGFSEMLHQCGFLFVCLSTYFLTLQDVPDSSFIFLIPIPESAFLQGAQAPFIGEGN